jgi:cobyrinic acid a,c-diamide synthase
LSSLPESLPSNKSSRVYISAAHKSSGKTIVSLGLCAAIREKGLSVQPFKKGPDYIDPLWLGRASQSHCINLDFNTQNRTQIVSSFSNQSLTADVAIVEGNKGLHDGVAIDGSDCNSELAFLLSIPVILVLDTQGTTRGIAPLLLGYQVFDQRINIAGVILNKVAGTRHEQKLRENVETHTDIPVLGSIPRDERLSIDERHLGLIPSSEILGADERIDSVRELVELNVDLHRLLALTRVNAESGLPAADENRAAVVSNNRSEIPLELPEPDLRIGIPRDRAFGFYYIDDLDALRREGCEVLFFDTVEDESIPEGLDGLFIGGGFPEVHMSALHQNDSMRESIRRFVLGGGPVYAECGGLMYLGQSIRWGEKQAEMVGVIPANTEMTARPVGRGYVELEETGLSPWGRISPQSQFLNAHEFHYSKIEILGSGHRYAYRVKRGWGIDGKNDGLITGNVLASYSHLRNIDPVNWTANFCRYVRKITGK